MHSDWLGFGKCHQVGRTVETKPAHGTVVLARYSTSGSVHGSCVRHPRHGADQRVHRAAGNYFGDDATAVVAQALEGCVQLHVLDLSGELHAAEQYCNSALPPMARLLVLT